MLMICITNLQYILSLLDNIQAPPPCTSDEMIDGPLNPYTVRLTKNLFIKTLMSPKDRTALFARIQGGVVVDSCMITAEKEFFNIGRDLQTFIEYF